MIKRHKGALIIEAAIIVPTVFIISLVLVVLSYHYYESVIGSAVLHEKIESAALYSGPNYDYVDDKVTVKFNSKHDMYWRFNRQQGSQPLNHFNQSKLLGVVPNKKVYQIHDWHYVSIPIMPYIIEPAEFTRNADLLRDFVIMPIAEPIKEKVEGTVNKVSNKIIVTPKKDAEKK